jgi:hypothetical protein
MPWSDQSARVARIGDMSRMRKRMERYGHTVNADDIPRVSPLLMIPKMELTSDIPGRNGSLGP